jgi:hypothetical protein
MKPGLFESIIGIISSAVGIVSAAKAHIPAIERTGNEVECPCCGVSFRLVERTNTNCECSYCFASEQERVLWLYLQRKTRLLTGKHDILWLSPEKSLGSKLQLMNNLTYSETPFTALHGPIDKAVRFESNSFDVLLCVDPITSSEDDFLALVRIYRMMKPGGWAALNAPKDQLTSAGFSVNTIELRDLITENTAHQFGVDIDSVVYVCAKPESISWVDQRYALNPIRQEKSSIKERIYVAAKFY